MAAFENLSTSEKIRIALHRDVTSICNESCHYRGFEITTPATAIIAELVFKKITMYGSDLESFAKHAKRSTINSEDVMLLARRNPSLRTHLSKICKNNPPVPKSKRRKTTDLKNENSAIKKQSIFFSDNQPLQKKRKISDEINAKENLVDQPKDVRISPVEAIDLTFD